MNKFHEFHRELLDVRKQLDRGDITPATVRERLAALLNRQESEAVHELGHYGLDTFRRAKYAMAALADELLLRDDPAHGERWMGQLIESVLFRSQRAGEKIFDDIDEMHTLGSSAGELARVYLAVLGLGFQGAFAGVNNVEHQLERYRQKLFRLAFGQEPAVTSGRMPIAVAAYASTLTDGQRSELPHLKPWIWTLVLLVVLYVAGGTAIWFRMTNDIDIKAVQTHPTARTLR